jgi:hypothetical protein
MNRGVDSFDIRINIDTVRKHMNIFSALTVFHLSLENTGNMIVGVDMQHEVTSGYVTIFALFYIDIVR